MFSRATPCAYQPTLAPTFAHILIQVVLWFWTYWRSLAQEDPPGSIALLRFITGSDRAPLDGFEPPLTIVEATDLTPESLPRAHTCFNTLVSRMFVECQCLTCCQCWCRFKPIVEY